MKFSIMLKEKLNKQIRTLMHNIDEINGGNEIGAWLLGEWEKKDEGYVLVLDDLHIPKQKVSSAEVDISPDSMIDSIRELGAENCNKIKAHWHIHPFSSGEANWSGIDETKIENFTAPEKIKEAFCFLLSSKSSIKARIILNVKGSVFNDEVMYIKHIIDEPEILYEIPEEETKIFNDLKKEISEKIEKVVYTYSKKTDSSVQTTIDGKVAKDDSDSDLFRVKIKDKKNKVLAIIDEDLYSFIEHSHHATFFNAWAEEVQFHAKDKVVVVTFNPEDEETNLDSFADELITELTCLQDFYYESYESMVQGRRSAYDDYTGIGY